MYDYKKFKNIKNVILYNVSVFREKTDNDT